MKEIDCVAYIREETPIADRYAQLAEECIEAAHAALKIYRIIRGVSPTETRIEDATAALSEELADIGACLDIIGIRQDDEYNSRKAGKIRRWFVRLGGKHER